MGNKLIFGVFAVDSEFFCSNFDISHSSCFRR